MVRPIVQSLEASFRNLPNTLQSTSSLNTDEWKTLSHSMTINELPKIELCGMESGVINGFGSDLYTNKQSQNQSQILSATQSNDLVSSFQSYFFLLKLNDILIFKIIVKIKINESKWKMENIDRCTSGLITFKSTIRTIHCIES